MSITGQLQRLQLVDSEWDERRQRLDEIEQALGDSQDVRQAREAVSEVERELHHLRARLRDLELEAGSLSDKLKANQARLYGKDARPAKELSKLEDEAKALRRRQSELEDSELELMFAIEGQEAELAERQARLRQIEATWQAEQAALLAEQQQLQGVLADLEEVRAGLRERIGRQDLALYDELRRSLGGIAVASLKKGICQVCGVDVPTDVARAVMRGEGVHYCPVCNRLLHGG